MVKSIENSVKDFDQFFKEELFEMATNLRPDETGLDRVIWVSTSEDGGQHGARIKVQQDAGSKVKKNGWVTVTINKDKEKRLVKHGTFDSSTKKQLNKFLDANYDILIQYWNDEISITHFLSQLKKNK